MNNDIVTRKRLFGRIFTRKEIYHAYRDEYIFFDLSPREYTNLYVFTYINVQNIQRHNRRTW